MSRPSSIRADLRALPVPAWTLFAGTFLNRFGGFVLPFLVLYLTSKRGLTVMEAGAAASLYGVGSASAVFVGGHLADRVGRRNAIALSMFASAAVMLALSQAVSLPALMALTLLAGFAAELYRPASAALVADLTPPGQRVTAFAMYRLAINAGVALGPAVAGLLSERSFTWLFVGDAVSSALFGLVALAALPHGVRARSREERSERAIPVILADRHFIRLLLATLALAVVFEQGYTTLALHVRDTGHSTAVYGALMSLNGVLIITLELALTALTQRFPARPVLTAGVLLAGAGFALTGVAASTAALAATVVVWTFGEMVFSPVAGAYVADIAPTTMRGRYQAAFGLCHSVGLVIAPAAGTALYERSPALLWGACGALGVVAAALILTSPARAPLPVSGHPEPTAG